MAVNAKLLPIDPFGFFGFGGGWSAAPLFSPVRRWGSTPSPKPALVPIPKVVVPKITSSKQLPGSTHWDPKPYVPVGQKGGGGQPGVIAKVIDAATAALPGVVFGEHQPDFVNTGLPPPILAGLPDIFPGSGGGYYEPKEEVDVAIEWGSLISGGIDLLQGQPIGGGFGGGGWPPYQPSFAPQIPLGTGDPTYNGVPAKVTVDTKTGKVTPCRRRRRRKLLTESDMCVLFQVATLPNNSNVRTALSRAICRR